MTQTLMLPRMSTDPVPFIDLVPQHQTIADEVMANVSRVFAEQKFILGEEVAEFECDVAGYCDVQFAYGCNSGTDALIIALQALGIGAGDEVITTPFSFFATASCITRAGATPVFADIDPVTFNLDPKAVAAAITPRTKAIIPVHLFGQCCDMEPLWRLASKHNLAIVEDAAQAIGAEYQGRKAGVLGDVAAFSFFPTKNLGGAGDGGMMVTNDAALAPRLKRLRVHGDVGQYEHLEVGMNSRLDALQATVLRVKLRHLESWSMKRQHNAKRYGDLFRAYSLGDSLIEPAAMPDRRHVFNQYCVRVRDGKRDTVLNELKARKVGCAVYYPKPLHLQTCFASLGYVAGDFPAAEEAAKSILALPIYPELPASHQDRVVECLSEICHGKQQSSTRRAA